LIWALVLVPLLAAFVVRLLPRRSDGAAIALGVFVALLVFVAAAFGSEIPDQSRPWLARPFTADLHVALGGGFAYWLVLLLSLTTACALFAAHVPRRRDFVSLMLALLGTMVGVFVARDLLLFALFWDLMLIPVFLILLGWAPNPRSNGAWRYLVYNLAGGLALLLATAAFGVVHGSTDVIGAAIDTPVGYLAGNWILAGFGFAFLVKTPIWPFHTWMPETYADLPAPAAAIVSAVQSKAGLYGFVVVGLPLLGEEMRRVAGVMVVLGLISLVYGAFVALVQDDAKRIVAYSSLSHLGLILVGIFSFDPIALGGVVVYAIAHGLFSAGLFIAIGFVEHREETRSLAKLGGLGTRNPKLAGGLLLVALAALGLPGLAGFAGEIIILTGTYRSLGTWPTLVALVPIVLAAAYMLRLFQGAMQGAERDDLPQRPDLSSRELAALAPLVLAVVVIGIDPAPLARLRTPMQDAVVSVADASSSVALAPHGGSR